MCPQVLGEWLAPNRQAGLINKAIQTHVAGSRRRGRQSPCLASRSVWITSAGGSAASSYAGFIVSSWVRGEWTTLIPYNWQNASTSRR